MQEGTCSTIQANAHWRGMESKQARSNADVMARNYCLNGQIMRANAHSRGMGRKANTVNCRCDGLVLLKTAEKKQQLLSDMMS